MTSRRYDYKIGKRTIEYLLTIPVLFLTLTLLPLAIPLLIHTSHFPFTILSTSLASNIISIISSEYSELTEEKTFFFWRDRRRSGKTGVSKRKGIAETILAPSIFPGKEIRKNKLEYHVSGKTISHGPGLDSQW